MSIENEKPVLSTNQSAVKSFRLKFSKKHLQGFVAGFLAAVILITGTLAAVNPGFLAGTFTKQIGNKTLQEEVDLQDVTCTPASLKAATSYDQKIVLNLKKDELKNVKKEDIYLQGLFEGLKVDSFGFENDKLTVTVNGSPLITHAYGSDMTNPSGDIYIQPNAVVKDKTAYVAKVQIEYPQLTAANETLLDKTDYNENLNFTLSGDEFAKTPTAADISLSGGFTGMSVSNISLNGQALTFNIKGKQAKDGGNGIVTLSNITLRSGFSVDKVINIEGAPYLYSITPLSVQQPLNKTITLNVSNDFFSDNVTPDMFTFGEGLENIKISKIERTDTNMSINVTLNAPSLLKVGIGTINLSKDALQSGRAVTGKIAIQNPAIVALKDKSAQEAKSETQVIDIFSEGNDFLPYISAADIVLKDSLSGLKISKVEWLSGCRIKITATGKPAAGDGIVSIRTAALGGVTGAEAKVINVDSLDIMGLVSEKDGKTSSSVDTPAISGQTGGVLSDIIDWGIEQVKGLVIEGIKSGAKEGATQGFMYALKQLGLMGPSVEETLKDIQNSLNTISGKMDTMETKILGAVKNSELQTRWAMLQPSITVIDTMYSRYEKLTKAIDDYKVQHPNEDPMENDAIKTAIENFAGPNGELKNKNLDICTLTISNELQDNSAGKTPLITVFYDAMKAKLPFEHNAAHMLKVFMQEMTLIQAKGLLLYAEYCNYNMANDPILMPNNLSDTTDNVNEGFNKQLNLLPSTEVLNILNKPNAYDITVKSNYDKDKREYIFVRTPLSMRNYILKNIGFTFNHEQAVFQDSYSYTYYTMEDYVNKYHTSAPTFLHWDGLTSYVYSKGVPDTVSIPTVDDITKLLNYKDSLYPDMTTKDYLLEFLKDENGTKVENIGDWLFAGQGPSVIWPSEMQINLLDLNLKSTTCQLFRCGDLYENKKDQFTKFVLVKR